MDMGTLLIKIEIAVIIIFISSAILYFVIKCAVKNGIVGAYKEIEKIKKSSDGSNKKTGSDNRQE